MVIKHHNRVGGMGIGHQRLELDLTTLQSQLLCEKNPVMVDAPTKNETKASRYYTLFQMNYTVKAWENNSPFLACFHCSHLYQS